MLKKSYVCYVYGQIYSEYLKADKAEYIMIENLHVREWQNILRWLKEKEYIKDYALGDTIETACRAVIQGFNEDKKIYKKYLEGIEKNLAA